MSQLDIVVSVRQKNRATINNLELDLDVFWRKYVKKRIYFMRAGRTSLQKLEEGVMRFQTAND